MHRHNCSLQDRRYFFLVFQAKWARSACTDHVTPSFAHLKKPEKKPVLQANLMANLQSDKNALQPDKKIT